MWSKMLWATVICGFIGMAACLPTRMASKEMGEFNRHLESTKTGSPKINDDGSIIFHTISYPLLKENTGKFEEDIILIKEMDRRSRLNNRVVRDIGNGDVVFNGGTVFNYYKSYDYATVHNNGAVFNEEAAYNHATVFNNGAVYNKGVVYNHATVMNMGGVYNGPVTYNCATASDAGTVYNIAPVIKCDG